MLYNQVIRELVTHENEIRDSRNKWLLLINSFMLGGYVTVLIKNEVAHNYMICPVIALVAFFVSLSFIYAAWRSSLSLSMALGCWDLVLERNCARVIDCPPVCLITKSIIEQIQVSSEDDVIGVNEWNALIYEKLLGKNSKKMVCMKKRLNKADFLMPYKFVPVIFTLLWISLFIISLMKVF